ncbi:hypothetical protein SAMN05444397_104200 [Flavobacterium aquidurense]|uniref:TonB-dependent Receptor Plug Domain n=1 Tax=Flavobacterium frigidimaris TaxID=262320 RepID=A0ABX4BRU7_FLAFR|nr:hypothetical protein [Flavobacterium frigidimaris]OXA79531.1 hypothetical protein B0A65_09160 [Flavobacterium frigidimaris]SDZ21686.1 hypothetical protein SAMN05444397_104200 [Flavobacterium aquidurense]
MKLIITFFSFLYCLQSFAQTTSNQDKITKYLNDYFFQDREIIHIQFNKSLFTNDEDIAFKGYILSKNNNIPNSNTTNVQLVVYNEEDQIVEKQLLFAQYGVFSGGIHLNEKFKSGKYHFHFYTNWMNNFKEDDSFNQTIEIIDKKTRYTFETKEPDWKTAEISLFPEGGIILNDIVNTIGIKITDCNKTGIEIADGIILDSKSNEITHFHTNQMGYGVFYLKADLSEKYTLKINNDKLKITQPLGKIAETGLILSAPNNPANLNLLVILKTNEKGRQSYQNKKFTVLIQQNGNSMQQEVTFNNNKTEQPFYFDKKYLSNGVNAIRVLDEDLNEITERLTYIEEGGNPSTTLNAKTMSNDSIILSGKADVNKAYLSISVLPEKSVCLNLKKTILGTFYLNAYLEKPEPDTYFYFNPDNKTRRKDIELLLLNQNKGKYLWENIKSGPPKISFEFEKGVTINGKVEKELKPNSNNKISLVALKNNLFEQTTIDQNNDFKFEHFFVQDSTVLALQMTNEKNITVTTKIEARIARNEPRFVLGPSFEKTFCPVIKSADNVFDFQPPKVKASELKEVAIKNTFKKEVFTHKSDMSLMAKAFKFDGKEYRSVLSFLSSNGYNAGVSPTDFTVYVKEKRSSFLGESASSPNIYIDNFLVFDFNQLFNITLDQVDEIYIDQTGSSDTSITGHGTIKIFMKTGQSNNYFKPKFTTLIVTKGFAKNLNYKTAPFENQDEFNYFGTLNWSPNIELNDHQDFQIKIPKNQQKEIQVLIEGFTNDGQLISEVKKVSVGGIF